MTSVSKTTVPSKTVRLGATFKEPNPQFDTIIIGASIAGSICALKLANKGWRVAVLEKRQSLLAYKKICTHIIHPYAVNQLKTLGIFDELLNKSAQMTCMNIHYRDRSVLYPFAGKLAAANIERKDLDPALRSTLSKHQNITLLTGISVKSFIQSGKHVIGVKTLLSNNETLNLHAPLVIGSDGRNSNVVNLSHGSIKKTENQRIALFSYFSTKTIINQSHVWALRQGQEYIGLFPNKQRVLISWYLPRQEFEDKQETHEKSFNRLLDYIADQDIQVGERLESIIVVKDSSPQTASTPLRSLALIGDTKLAADPLTGIGCTWAMQSANLLVKCLGKAPSNKNSSCLNISIKLSIYTFVHSLAFKLPSTLMTFISMHGKWVFNPATYSALAWFTRKESSKVNPQDKQ